MTPLSSCDIVVIERLSCIKDRLIFREDFGVERQAKNVLEDCIAIRIVIVTISDLSVRMSSTLCK